MSGYVLHLPEDESIVLSGPVTRRLLQAGDGDAALLYIAVLRSRGSVDDERLLGELRWDKTRFDRALVTLTQQGLISRPGAAAAAPVTGAPAVNGRERAEYTRMDMTRALEGKEFAGLTAAVEERLGKKLATPDLGRLLGLYDDVGLPADVIYLLVSFCVTRSADKYGPGRKPTMRQIEQEGYTWARLGLMDQASASEYIRKYAHGQEQLPRMMALLGLRDRKPSVTEEKYMISWSGMGFEDAVIERAYDRTVLKCRELKWPYMNKILTAWHQKGYRTVRDVEEGESRSRTAPATPADRDGGEAARENIARMEKYLRRLREQGADKEER